MAGPLVAAITARMGSERLPGKVMMDLAGKPVTAHMVERLQHVEGVDAVWLATSKEENNEPLIDLCRSLGIEVYAGDPEDVLERHVTIARRTGAEAVLRVTADCPLFDIPLASRMIAHHRATGADFTYVPAVLSVGVLVEVISSRALEIVHARYQGELITVPIKEHPEEFHIEPFDVGGRMDPALYRPEFRLTLDEPADYAVLKAVYEALYEEGKPVAVGDALRFLESHPEIAKLNAEVAQKRGNLYAQELDARVLSTRRTRSGAGSRRIFVRADGGERLGFGHLLRCHAFAQAARRRGLETCFLTRPMDGTGVKKLEALGETLEPVVAPEDGAADLEATLGAMRRLSGTDSLDGAILLTDHNGLDAGWIAGAREEGAILVSLNDLPRIRYASHIVVNGNLDADRFDYKTGPDTRLLLGPSYHFFRDEFLEPGLTHGTHPAAVRRLLVSLGGGDPSNVTQLILEHLETLKRPLEVTLLLGGAYTHQRSLSDAARRSRHDVRVERDLQSTATPFARADLAICAGGSTAYELALLGVPTVVLVLSETQGHAARALDAAGAAICPGAPDPERVIEAVERLLDDQDRRREMGTKGRALFDGRGRERVLDAIQALATARPEAVR